MPADDIRASRSWRVIVVGGHTRNIGKTQLVCDLINATCDLNWTAVKITQYGHGVCAQNGEDCDCAPSEHTAALDLETCHDTGTDTARFLSAGAKRALWLRTKQGFLAEGLPLLRAELERFTEAEVARERNLILESNSLLQFVRPLLYLVVVDPQRDDFKDSARLHLDRASAFVLRRRLSSGALEPAPATPGWGVLPARVLSSHPCFFQEEGEDLPAGLLDLVRSSLLRGECASL